MEQALLQCTNLVKCYGKKQALNGVDLTVMPGRITGLLGPNGSGKTTIIKIANGLLTPTSGELRINGLKPCAQTKAMVSYLPERTYLANWMKVQDIIRYFQDFYTDFDPNRAFEMLRALNINPEDPLKTMSKGMREKVQLILVMSRRAQLYILDEPIAGVDPAARDYILRTILNNYDSNAAILICTHLISDVESVLDDVIFLRDGNVVLQSTTDEIREKEGKSVDQFFREVFKC